jgi:hypothetical protein
MRRDTEFIKILADVGIDTAGAAPDDLARAIQSEYHLASDCAQGGRIAAQGRRQMILMINGDAR